MLLLQVVVPIFFWLPVNAFFVTTSCLILIFHHCLVVASFCCLFCHCWLMVAGFFTSAGCCCSLFVVSFVTAASCCSFCHWILQLVMASWLMPFLSMLVDCCWFCHNQVLLLLSLSLRVDCWCYCYHWLLLQHLLPLVALAVFVTWLLSFLLPASWLLPFYVTVGYCCSICYHLLLLLLSCHNWLLDCCTFYSTGWLLQLCHWYMVVCFSAVFLQPKNYWMKGGLFLIDGLDWVNGL